MMYKASFRVYDNSDLAYKCFLAEKEKKKRFKLDIKKEKGYVELKVEAEDITALKAITTSMIKLLEVYEKLQERLI